MEWKTVLAISFIAMLFAGCTGPIPGPTPFEEADDSQATEAGIAETVQGNNQFALELYKEFREDPQNEGKNIFFSPYSISTALAMTYEGARSTTAEEMQTVLHFQDDAVRRASFARLYNILNDPNKPFTLRTANALWAQQDYEFLQEYFDVVKKYYQGNVTNLDFKTQTEASRLTINKWVEDQTNNLIKDLIPQGAVTALTRLVLTNAIYFKGQWATQFDSQNTKEQDFLVEPENPVVAKMMFLAGEDAECNYAETSELQALEMPYKGEDLSMLVLLPKENDLAALESSLDAKKLSEVKAMMHKREIDIYFPKFEFEAKYFMVPTLKDMGMKAAFVWPGADFSGMDGTKDLFISDVIHQAYVKVDEEGTEAAAATAVIMELGAMMPTIFRADHPFIFIIQENTTGQILFLGRVSDPTQE